MSKVALIVDDSESIRRVVEFTLTDAGFEVVEAENGQAAIDKAAGLTVDVVVTDLNMPIMDGIELIRRLRAEPNFKFTPILMLTTESQDSRKQEGKEAGATGWIVKPFEPVKFMQVIQKVVR